MNEFRRFRPIPQERVWGGRALETTLGRELPPGNRPFGESWEIVDRPEAQSVVVGGKFAGSVAGSRLAGLGWRDSAIIGVLMNTRGLMELIVLNIGLELGIISPPLFAMMVLMALATTMMTGPLLRLADR
jgi:hypothetical protein